MSSTGTRKARDVQSRANDAITENDKNFIANLKLFSGESDPIAGGVGQGLNSSPNTPTGNYVAREGDSMIGALALGPPSNFRVEIAVDDSINLSPNLQNPQFSSNIELDAVQPNSLVLTRIDGAAFDGQLLIIRTFGPDSFTISQMTLGNGGNIQTPGDEDFELAALQMIVLVFDEALVAFANTGGTWRVLSTAGGGATTGTYASAKLDQNQIVNLALNNHFQFNDYVENGGIVLQGLTPTFDQTSGIFELKAGVTYFLYADASVEFNSNADAAQIVWYDRTNAVELGQRASSDPLSSASQLSNKHAIQTIITPVTDIDVEVRIVTLSGAINTVYADDSQVNIFEFSGKNGAPGTPGADGSTAWKTPARAKTLIDVPSLAAFTVLTDGVTLVQGNRVLLTEQITQSENGLWEVGVVAAGLAPLTRPTDFDSDAEVIAETFVAIEEGTISKDSLWHLISNNPLTIDVSDQVWDIFAPGLSGGPGLGAGEDGIDAAGEWVYDGRTATGNFVTQRWESVPIGVGPNNGIGEIIWIPPFGEVAGRLVIVGGQTGLGQNSSAYSDDLGTIWSDVGSIDTEDFWGVLAYDGTGRSGSFSDPAQGVLVAAVTNGVFSTNRNLRRSLDRGATWSTITSPNTDLHRDLIWAEDPGGGQFVITNYTTGAPPPSNIRGIWTSPDGVTWTVRVTPVPATNANQSWSYVVYSPSLDLYVCTTLGSSGTNTDIITSSDGITWTQFASSQPLLSISKIIWSEGQQKFVCISTDPILDIIYSFTSKDGINWERFTVATVFPPAVQIQANGIVWAPNLSMYVISGGRTALGHRFEHFWVSQDAETWDFIPRMPVAMGFSPVGQITYSEEYTKFFTVRGVVASTGNLIRTTR